MQSFNTRLVFDKTANEVSPDSPLKRLGNVTEVETPQQLDYYPFGLQQQGVRMFRSLQEPKNRYRFNGIEHEESMGLDLAMYRSYDATLGRFQQIDPFAEAFSSSSPYAFVENNPISYADPLGLFKTKFGAWLHKFFNGGDEIRQDSESGEWFVGTERKEENAVVYSRVFSGNSDKPSGGITNAVDALPSNLGFAGKQVVMQGEFVENTGDVISGAGLLVTPYFPQVGPWIAGAGEGVSLTGVGLQITEIWLYQDMSQIKKIRETAKKLAVEGLPILAVLKFKRVLKGLNLTKEESAILESVIEGGGYLLEKTGEGTVSDVIDAIFDEYERRQQ